ncbi:MAG: 6,7-dimethyl-8-ribityllumazine synthase [Candidatus Omnitrophica bacterium]|nr:6,7-dimethyl-8-ribityllumazine synthase [Candidatus Omnitrophota bacterium]
MIIRRGNLKGDGKRFAIVVARFNEFITKRLLESAVEVLEQAGVSQKDIEVAWVPGALEIPYFCKKLAARKLDGIIALGCVLRGGTYHYECVCNEVTRGISQVALETGIPIATAVITADTLEQAIDRAGLKAGNKGAHAALAAIEIADLNRQMDQNTRVKGRQRRVKNKR